MVVRGGGLVLAAALLGLVPGTAPAQRSEWSGEVALEARRFPEPPLSPLQHGDNLSAAVRPQYYREWDGGRRSFRLELFGRVDQGDDERTHADVRELSWTWVSRDWEVTAGIGRVFWGVTESLHLVDIVNQTALVENPDGEDKLGQPLLRLALIRDWGTLEAFVLPGFRERTFPGPEGRLWPALPLAPAVYESPRRRSHVDGALRWSHSTGIWDLGLSVFRGTSREPRLVIATDPFGRPRAIVPVYDIIDQAGVDVQATLEDWLWKLEWIRRRGQGPDFTALAAGFEYTFYGVLETAADVGLVAEYLHDSRDDAFQAPFQDDVFVGLRLTLNDVQSTELLAGVIADRRSGERFYSVEASRRLGESWTVSLEGRWFSGGEPGSLLHALRNDDYLQLEAAWHF